MSALPKPIWTPETYLEFERQSPTRHEYFHGEIFDMAGASEVHGNLAANLMITLGGQLKKRPCKIYASDLRVYIKAYRHYTYPDLVVVCGKPLLEDHHGDTLLNPIVIMEVLSDSTEGYDRGMKFAHYRSIQSLQEYVLVSQNLVQIEHYRRDGDEWRLRVYNSLAEVVTLPSLECQLELADVYDKTGLGDEPSVSSE